MKNSEILAVVVSYNGKEKIAECVNSLLDQVGAILVVDNGSDDCSIKVLSRLNSDERVYIEYLKKNLGMSSALNFGVLAAKDMGFRWILTMDQDSVPAPTMVQRYIEKINLNPDIKVLSPNFSHNTSKENIDIVEIEYAITSGNLICLDVFDVVGGFDERFFIDGVDFDFSLRLRSNNIKIYRLNSATMGHQIGDHDTRIPLISRFHSYHSPLRRYYIFRNLFILIEKHFFSFPFLISKVFVSRIIYLITILILGKDRMDSFYFIGLGAIDFFQGKLGKK